MAATYEPIATTTLGSAASSITFSSISSAYTDLRLVLTVTASANNTATCLRFNGDTATNYSLTYLGGTGAAAASGSGTNSTFINPGSGYSTTYTGTPTLHTFDIFSYAGSTYKTVLFTDSTDNNGSGYVQSGVGLWRSTSAINSITILTNTANTYSIGTTATLYGIKAA